GRVDDEGSTDGVSARGLIEDRRSHDADDLAAGQERAAAERVRAGRPGIESDLQDVADRGVSAALCHCAGAAETDDDIVAAGGDERTGSAERELAGSVAAEEERAASDVERAAAEVVGAAAGCAVTDVGDAADGIHAGGVSECGG